MISYSLIGLLLVIFGWLIQLIKMKKDLKINPCFVGLYSLGVLILVYDGFNSGLNNLATANLFSLIISAIILFKILKKNKK